ncbi:MAG TPA: type IV toxin-antitoxin system AbiEi family antitoxin domain-containing protein [Egibacteraceae bacterium]|nr:type IV toxin-antitoxin system AbiEi family antitoxin domain-containing protein [Egibacteraceae bacterium]
MDDRSGWRLLDEFGMRQHGYVHVRQARAAGVPDATFRRYAAERAVDRPHPGVVRLLGAPRTMHGQIMAALLAVGDPAALGLDGSMAVGPRFDAADHGASADS